MAKERRLEIKKQCQQFGGGYAILVEPINDMLIALDADISAATTEQILKNIKLYAEGGKYLPDCHLDESDHFLTDGIEALKDGDLGNGALQIFGAGLNFASFAAKTNGLKSINAHQMLEERFGKLKNIRN
ncbi:hypothetical protein MFLO_01820 [Listeria floridensis FSL S10-1187]|uniref:Uncharacterized protein n=1 Tax=Listeria floridensis FSL S10-1187 TaxID=1265817 RepID=A0ABP3B1W8_9LIST|nr:hypothetical protein MFLO_01820 [Listeria floridensis FSL S10-1187]